MSMTLQTNPKAEMLHFQTQAKAKVLHPKSKTVVSNLDGELPANSKAEVTISNQTLRLQH